MASASEDGDDNETLLQQLISDISEDLFKEGWAEETAALSYAFRYLSLDALTIYKTLTERANSNHIDDTTFKRDMEKLAAIVVEQGTCVKKLKTSLSPDRKVDFVRLLKLYGIQSTADNSCRAITLSNVVRTFPDIAAYAAVKSNKFLIPLDTIHPTFPKALCAHGFSGLLYPSLSDVAKLAFLHGVYQFKVLSKIGRDSQPDRISQFIETALKEESTKYPDDRKLEILIDLNLVNADGILSKEVAECYNDLSEQFGDLLSCINNRL